MVKEEVRCDREGSGQVTAARLRPTLTMKVLVRVAWGTTKVMGPPSGFRGLVGNGDGIVVVVM